MAKRLTVKQAAEQLQVSIPVVRQMCEDRELGRAVKGPGGKTVYLIYQNQVDEIKKAAL